MAALRAGEGWLQIESWPLSYVPMFATRVPPDVLSLRYQVQYLSDGAWRPRAAINLRLTKDELRRSLTHAPDLAARCSELGRIYRRRAPGP
jgi:hypothetical protein